MGKVITVGNYKGGVGKSTLTEMLAYIYAIKDEKKVLVIDTDPQTNVTDKLFKTFNKSFDDMPDNNNRLMGAINQADLNKAIVKMTDNLDLMVGDWDIENFPDYISTVNKKARYYLLYTLLEDIVPDYDYILIDTRPSTDLVTNNVICASDYVLVASKTEEDSFNSTIKYISYLQRMIEYNNNLQLLGIVNYLVNARGYVDKQIVTRFKKEFTDISFQYNIQSSEVVKRWGLEGITEHRPYDKKVLSMYTKLADEVNERIEALEK